MLVKTQGPTSHILMCTGSVLQIYINVTHLMSDSTSDYKVSDA